MFQLPLLGSTLQTFGKGIADAPGQSDRGLIGLLHEGEGPVTAFGGELQALLMQLSPAMLQRLDQLLAGGKSLPQAASSLLDEFAGDLSEKGFGSMLQRLALLNGDNNAPPRVPPDGARIDADPVRALPAAPHLLGASPAIAADTTAALLTPPAATFASPVATTPTMLSPQLANTLLDMGVPQRVGARDWPSAIAERVSWMVNGEQQFARLRLNPPNLGPLEVRVSVSQEQANVAFLAQHAAVREALEAALPRLRELFDQSSLQLVHADVSDPGAEHGHGSDEARSGHMPDGGAVSDPVAEQADSGATSVHTVGVALVDLFV